MGLKPNLVVGLVGVVVFLLGGLVIASNFRGLVDLGTYESEFTTLTERFAVRGNTLGPGTAGRTESYVVTNANVTSVKVRLTWEELVANSHEVTLVVKSSRGVLVDQKVGTGGVAGLTVEETLRPVPQPERFTEVNSRINDEFRERYGEYIEDRGAWTAQVLSKGPANPTDRGISYTLSFDYVYWTGRFIQIPEASK